jgi:hypothetical protein
MNKISPSRKLIGVWSVDPIHCVLCGKKGLMRLGHDACNECADELALQHGEAAIPKYFVMVECAYCAGKGHIPIGSGPPEKATMAGCRRCRGYGSRFRKKSPLELLGECAE